MSNTEFITEFGKQEEIVPHIDIKNAGNIPKEVIDKYGVTDVQKILLRNWEKQYVGAVGALQSIAGKCIVFEKKDNLYFSITSSKGGGVQINYPADKIEGQKGPRQTIHNKEQDMVQLHEAHLRYNIPNHSIIVGDLADMNKDYMNEATEQLAAEFDYLLLNQLKTSVITANEVDSKGSWNVPVTATDIAKDIKHGLQLLVENSAINPNWVNGSEMPQYTLILPLAAQEYMENVVVIDGSRQTLGDFLQNRYKFQTLYSRAPFEFHETWPYANDMYIIPTYDPRVGKMYTFDGAGRVPSQYIKHDIDGLDTSLLWWFNYNIGRDEKDLVKDKSRRVVRVKNIITGT